MPESSLHIYTAGGDVHRLTPEGYIFTPQSSTECIDTSIRDGKFLHLPIYEVSRTGVSIERGPDGVGTIVYQQDFGLAPLDITAHLMIDEQKSPIDPMVGVDHAGSAVYIGIRPTEVITIGNRRDGTLLPILSVYNTTE